MEEGKLIIEPGRAQEHAWRDGHGVKVDTSAGTDYVFLGSKPFSSQEGMITFSTFTK